MAKAKLDILEEPFSKQVTQLSELSVLLGVNSLSYMVTTAQRKIMILREYDLVAENISFQELLTAEENLHLPYKQVRAAIISPTFTLVPERLYNTLERRTYLQEIATLTYDVEVRADELKNVQARLVYALPHDISDVVTKQLTHATVFHATSALLAGLLARQNTTTSPILYLQINYGWIVAVLLEGKNLLFVNAFNYQSAKDLLYYVMLIFDQYKLTPEETPVYISGQLLENSEIYTLLQRYIRSLRFLPAPDFLQMGNKLQQQPAYFYFNLFGVTKL